MFSTKDESFLTSDITDIQHGFGTKQFGDGRNSETIKKLRSLFQNKPTIVIPQQTHSTNIKIIDKTDNDILFAKNTDALITKEKNILLTVITADCMPILFVDPLEEIVGIAHVGWKGTLNRLPAKMVDTFVELGSLPRNIKCILGPSIHDCCYEIYGERQQAFLEEFKTDSIFRKDGEKQYLNMNNANILTLADKKILLQNMDISPFCTSTEESKFWSNNRDKGIEGEMISYIYQS